MQQFFFHFFHNPVPLLCDISKCYRSIRTKFLTNVFKKIMFLSDLNDPTSI